MLNPDILAFIVSDISAFIRSDGQMETLFPTRYNVPSLPLPLLSDESSIIHSDESSIPLETLPSPCYISDEYSIPCGNASFCLSDESSIPFTLRVTGPLPSACYIDESSIPFYDEFSIPFYYTLYGFTYFPTNLVYPFTLDLVYPLTLHQLHTFQRL